MSSVKEEKSKGTVNITVEHYNELRDFKKKFDRESFDFEGGVIKMTNNGRYVSRNFEYEGDDFILTKIIEELDERESKIERLCNKINDYGILDVLNRKIFG